MRRAPMTMFAGLLFMGASAAYADLPPPDGRKYVSFAFGIDNLSAFPDYAVVAYPASESGGAPTHEVFVVADGKMVRLGRRSPDPTLYAMKRADFDAMKDKFASLVDKGEDAEVNAFFASEKAIKCNLAPSPVFELASSDPREQVEQRMRAVAIDDKACKLVSNAPSTSNPESPPPKGGGCAGCETSRSATSSLGLLGVALFAARRRRC